MNHDREETYASCLFYQLDCEDVGTCKITENIVEAQQEACNDHIKTDR